MPNRWRGEAIFIEDPVLWSTLDCAYQGEDFPVASFGRYGKASGWIDVNGNKVVYVNSKGTPTPKHVLQYDSQIRLMKSDPVELAEEYMKMCKDMHIDPKWVGIDATGSGFGTFAYLRKFFGDILELQWGRKATEHKVLYEDPAAANTVYDGLISEMWFSARRWFESGVILISPSMPTSPLFQQLTTRRYRSVRGGLFRIESKPEYKARGNKSPDEADSFIMAPQLIRMRHDVLPGMRDESSKVEEHDSELSDEDKPLESVYLDGAGEPGEQYLDID
jgi:hypothetical protein